MTKKYTLNIEVVDESVFVKFSSEEERLAALRKMVGMRKIFEARAREIYEKKYGVSVAQ